MSINKEDKLCATEPKGLLTFRSLEDDWDQ